MPEATKTTSRKTAPKTTGVKRNFNKEKIIHHDCFKLEPAEMQKNMSWIKKKPKYQSFEHCHTFHSFDSQGRKQIHSTPIGGHFHIMEFIEHKDGSVEAKCVSGPMKMGVVWDERLERDVRKPVPINPRDHHTHEVSYIHSEQLTKRKPNIEAGKLMTKNAELTKPPEGTEV